MISRAIVSKMAVSYTHLDVYKRQGVEGQKTYIVKEGVLTSYLHDRISAKHYGVNPVSYTHLDVYKRQSSQRRAW